MEIKTYDEIGDPNGIVLEVDGRCTLHYKELENRVIELVSEFPESFASFTNSSMHRGKLRRHIINGVEQEVSNA